MPSPSLHVPLPKATRGIQGSLKILSLCSQGGMLGPPAGTANTAALLEPFLELKELSLLTHRLLKCSVSGRIGSVLCATPAHHHCDFCWPPDPQHSFTPTLPSSKSTGPWILAVKSLNFLSPKPVHFLFLFNTHGQNLILHGTYGRFFWAINFLSIHILMFASWRSRRSCGLNVTAWFLSTNSVTN